LVTSAATVIALSDDLTGSTACAAELMRAGITLPVRSWDGPVLIDERERGVVVNTASRLLDPATAAARLTSVVERCRADCAEPTRWYKRVDSGLRGNVGAEIVALSDCLGLPCLLAPASPAWGVTTHDGGQWINDVPVAESDYRGLEKPVSSRFEDLLGRPVGEFVVSQGGAILERLAEALDAHRYLACRVTEETHFEFLADAVAALPAETQPILVGSYGLAGAWARRIATAQHGPGVLVVAGSPQAATQQQVHLLRHKGARIVGVPSAASDRAGAVAEIVEALTSGVDAIVDASGAHLSGDTTVAQRAAAVARDALRKASAAGLILIGGEAASAVVRACGVTEITPVSEPWPAAPIVRFTGGLLDGMCGVTKSGSRGEPDWLVYAIAALRQDARLGDHCLDHVVEGTAHE